MTYALRLAAMRAILMFSVGSDGQSHKTVSTNHNLWHVRRWWLLLYSPVLRSRADSLRSHVILHEWLAFYSAFLNIHRSGVLIALTWLMPYETAAVSYMRVCANWWGTGISCFCENVTIAVHVHIFWKQDDSDSKLVKTKQCHILSGSQAQGTIHDLFLYSGSTLSVSALCACGFSLGAYSPVWSDRALITSLLSVNILSCRVLVAEKADQTNEFYLWWRLSVSCVCVRKSRPN